MPARPPFRPSVYSVTEPKDLQALSHPTRVAILEALRDPASAATVARAIGQPRQLVNYHLKELKRAGLVEPAGERRKGNFVEQLYRAVAQSFVVSPRVAWSDARRVEALRRQHTLATLVEQGERLQRDAAVLLDRAAFDGEEVASAAVTADVRFASEDDRAAFMDAYLRSLRDLLERHGSRDGEPYRVMLAVYPEGGE
ncbi:MAG: helix-turn-helix domain-containing protein [Dehalococcoidia bacterium]|nr:helix-turn-helix domain-containing protein [Dehalococcoidia bacterium]